MHGSSDVPKPREHKVRGPLETHTEPLAPFFIEKPENTSVKEGNLLVELVTRRLVSLI